MRSRASFLIGAAALFVPVVLLLERESLGSQLGLGTAAAVFLWLFVRASGVEVRSIATAIAVATAGELILSVGWGLYEYRFTELLPLYVPFGHGLFYALAVVSQRDSRLERHASAIVRAVLWGGSLLAAGSLVLFDDVWGAIWWIVAAVLIARSRSSLLLAICMVYTVALEWLGTALGNWKWAAEVPLLGLPSGNPPSGVGLLYVLLDLITVALCTRMATAPARLAAARKGTVILRMTRGESG